MGAFLAWRQSGSVKLEFTLTKRIMSCALLHVEGILLEEHCICPISTFALCKDLLYDFHANGTAGTTQVTLSYSGLPIYFMLLALGHQGLCFLNIHAHQVVSHGFILVILTLLMFLPIKKQIGLQTANGYQILK